MNDRFRLLLHATIGVAIVTYSVAEENFLLGVTAMAVWSAAWPISLGHRGRPLPRLVIGLLVLAATALMLLRLLQAPQELVTIVSQYLLWMQLIKLYDRVGVRDEAQLLAMSMALVIGACLTSSRLLLGTCLLVYAPMALWTAAALQMHAGRLRDATRRERAGAPLRQSRFGGASTPEVTRALKRVVAMSVVAIAALTVVGFIFLPRSDDSSVSGELLSQAAQTSFNDEVTLGQEGLISESQRAVLNVDIEREVNGASVGVALPRLYLRGAALDSYEGGRWTSLRREASTTLIEPGGEHRIDMIGDDDVTFRLRVQYLWRDKPQVFTMQNPVKISFDRLVRLQIDRFDQTITTTSTEGLPTYTVESRPDAAIIEPLARRRRLPPAFREGAIRDAAIDVLTAAGLARDPEVHFSEDDWAIAMAIESHLRMRCEYTTEMVAPEPDEDPIEMFLFRSQRGHCEYFASSMAAMLRAVGIDARVITGYIVDGERLASESFIVRENDAHAWVEAQVEPGVWRTFDPSPPAQVDALRVRATGLAAVYLSIREGLQDFWARQIVGFNRASQEEMLGSWRLPIEEQLRRRLEGAGRGLRASPLNAAVSAMLSGVIVFAATAAAFFAGRAGARQIGLWLRRRRDLLLAAGADAEARRRLEQAAFYHDAAQRLRRAGLGRPAWMSPLTHARRLTEIDDALADATRSLAELYYAARYGRQWPSTEEQAAAGETLRILEERLREVRPGRVRRSGDLS